MGKDLRHTLKVELTRLKERLDCSGVGGKGERAIKNESQVSDLGDWVDVFPLTEFETLQSRSLWEAVAGNPELGFEHRMSELSLMSK